MLPRAPQPLSPLCFHFLLQKLEGFSNARVGFLVPPLMGQPGSRAKGAEQDGCTGTLCIAQPTRNHPSSQLRLSHVVPPGPEDPPMQFHPCVSDVVALSSPHPPTAPARLCRDVTSTQRRNSPIGVQLLREDIYPKVLLCSKPICHSSSRALKAASQGLCSPQKQRRTGRKLTPHASPQCCPCPTRAQQPRQLQLRTHRARDGGAPRES